VEINEFSLLLKRKAHPKICLPTKGALPPYFTNEYRSVFYFALFLTRRTKLIVPGTIISKEIINGGFLPSMTDSMVAIINNNKQVI
jgi:hypothetical protein